MLTEQVVIPKSFFIQERDHLYNDPLVAFWREMFQNSIDAGAKNINIDIKMTKGRGAFGRYPNIPEAIRISFKDDGTGMTPDVIDNVFFRIGESTKRGGGSTGGFGRARILTCFAADQYRLVTGTRYVEGDGGEKLHHSFEDKVDIYEQHLAEVVSSGQMDEDTLKRIDQIEADLVEMRRLRDGKPVKGCHFIIDMNPNEYPESRYRNPSVDTLNLALIQYLKMSQLTAKVMVNGEERKDRSLKGPAKRVISAELPDGTTHEFGTVHLSATDKAEFKRRAIIRVDGTTMFDEYVGSDIQVIIELDKARSREVMTSNRDGFRGPYKDAFTRFCADLISDVRSALDNEENTTTTISGGLGRMVARRPHEAISFGKMEGMDDQEGTGARAGKDNSPSHRPLVSSSTAASSLETNGYGDVPYPVLQAFFEAVRKGDATFLSDYAHGDLLHKLQYETVGRYDTAMVRCAIEAMEPAQLEFVIGELRRRMLAEEEKAREEMEARLAGLPDIRIRSHGKITGKLRRAMTYHDPRNWNVEAGTGIRSRMLLAAWVVIVDEAIKTMLKFNPEAVQGDVSWIPGLIFSAPTSDYRMNRSMDSFVREAEHSKLEDGTHIISVGPVDSEGKLRYNPAKTEDQNYLISIAAHEVCHITSRAHDEDFASLLTAIMGRLDTRSIRSRVKAAIEDVREIYRSGSIRAQAMDNQPGPRPIERIAAQLAPHATVAAALLSGTNAELVGGATLQAYRNALSRDEDGVLSVDLDTLGQLDESVVLGMEMGAQDEEFQVETTAMLAANR